MFPPKVQCNPRLRTLALANCLSNSRISNQRPYTLTASSAIPQARFRTTNNYGQFGLDISQARRTFSGPGFPSSHCVVKYDGHNTPARSSC